MKQFSPSMTASRAGGSNSRRRRLRAWVASTTAVLLALSGAVVGATPAWADLGDPGQITLDKSVDLQDSITASPGDTFTYGFLVGCDDNPCIGAVLDDQLPPEFSGFTIESVQVSPPSAPVTAVLSNCSVGDVVTANCLLHADFLAPLGDLDGEPQFGIAAGVTYRINVQLTVPLSLPATWAHNGVAVDNTAVADAETSATPAQSTATVTVDIPIEIDVTPTKSWSPSSQLYNPGDASTFTIGAQNSSNLPAESLVLQDPVIAPEGAAFLDPSNPFTYVDFTALCTPADLPEGADLVQVDLYVLSVAPGNWNWVTGTPSATPTLPAYSGDVGGIRLTYTSTTGATIVPTGTASSQCVSVAQRTDNRTTGASLIGGATVDNTVGATLTVPGHAPVTDTASAALTIGPLNVIVTPGKTITPAVIPAGADFTVNLSALNSSNGPLTSLTITEPGPTAAAFLSDELTFDGFTSWTWPIGATAGTFEWHFNSAASSSVSITELGGPPAVPTPAAGDWITGFTVTYTGSIPEGTSAGFIYSVTSDPTMIDPTTTAFEDFVNAIEVTGTNPAGTDTKPAQDDVRIYFPEIELAVEKTIRPGLVTPGGTVVAELETETSTNSARVNPTQIVIEDVWDGTADTSFWNAFRAQELAFIQIPSDSTLTVRYTTDAPASAPITWTDIVIGTTGTGGLYSHDLSGLPDSADDITGFQFVFDSTDAAGFSRGTIVKPNIVFEAAATLRSGGPTTLLPGEPVEYDNVTVASGTGESGGMTVTGDPVQDDDSAEIVSFGGGTGTGPGVDSLLSDKDWVTSNWSSNLNLLAAQSGATARTAHGWGVTVPGYDAVVLSDALPGTETAAQNTVFQAFDLTGIRAITFVQDPLLRWDTVSQIEIYVGGVWTTIAAPGGSWMSATGFKGYNPSGAALTTLRSATGVRITVVADDAARAASTDPGRPAVGSGVAWGAVERPLWLQWQLRNAMRVPTGSGWVAATQSFNHADPGTIRNDFRVAGTAGVDTFTRDESDTIVLIDNPPGVGIAKTAATTPATTPPLVVVPHPGDVDPADYPTVRFTVDAWNTAAARASYLRVSDPMPGSCSPTCVTPADYWDPDVFTTRTYDPVTNPFERFTITGVSFAVPGAVPIDQNATQVALWRYDGVTGTTSVTTTTMALLIAMDAAALSDVVGIGIVYQSTDPATTGGLIPQGSATSNRIRMMIDTQLRATMRSDDSAVTEGGLEIDNDAQAQSYDPILHATATPYAGSFAIVELSSARLDVTASKQLSPSTVYETNPTVPVTVTLGATDGDATAAAQQATITDTDADFWNSFELVSLGGVTRPAGAALARVDVQLDNDATWVLGTAVAAPADPALPSTLTLPDDLERITGIRYVFNNDPVRPFSATAPSAAWSAQAQFTVQARETAVFPSSVDNEINVVAEHTGLPPASATDSDDIVLTTGTPRIDVQKEPITGGPKIVEPGVAYPWTLEFENVGTAFFTVNDVIENLGPNLQFDGSEPLFETNSATMPTTGISINQATAEEITFTFPADSVLAPGEWYRITLNLELLPGLTPSEQAVNRFFVDTDAVFAAGDCVNTSGNGQGVLAGLEANQCGTSNFVSPQAGPLLFVEKEVRGEIDGTLVSGASNLINPALPCSTTVDAFHRSNCVAFTAIGATDEWRVGAVNTGTIAYENLTFVDVLPNIGDRLLATGSARGSNWRPVFDLDFGIQVATDPGLPGDGVPAGTAMVFEVTTDTAPCVGTGPGTAWPTDLICAGNTWQAIGSYSGSATDITGIRISLDFTTSAGGVLPPGGSVHFLHRTVNTPWSAGDLPTAEAIRPRLTTGPSLKAWNQVGAVATQAGSGESLSRAPQRVGVQLLTGSASVEKTVSGNVSLAPDEVTVDAVCTVPTGVDAERVPVELATLSTLTVPVGGTARLDGVPLGAECDFAETGALGHFGEAERTPNGPQTVQITTAGETADPVPVEQSVSINNRYASLGFTGTEVRGPLTLAFTLLGLGVLTTLISRRRRLA